MYASCWPPIIGTRYTSGYAVRHPSIPWQPWHICVFSRPRAASPAVTAGAVAVAAEGDVFVGTGGAEASCGEAGPRCVDSGSPCGDGVVPDGPLCANAAADARPVASSTAVYVDLIMSSSRMRGREVRD